MQLNVKHWDMDVIFFSAGKNMADGTNTAPQLNEIIMDELWPPRRPLLLSCGYLYPQAGEKSLVMKYKEYHWCAARVNYTVFVRSPFRPRLHIRVQMKTHCVGFVFLKMLCIHMEMFWEVSTFMEMTETDHY